MIPVLYYERSARSRLLDDIIEQVLEQEMSIFASELAVMGLNEQYKLDLAIQRAIKVCLSGGFPIRYNFKRIYICSEGNITHDWLLSPLACRLVIMNADASDAIIARAQLNLLQSNIDVWESSMK